MHIILINIQHMVLFLTIITCLPQIMHTYETKKALFIKFNIIYLK